MEGRPVDEKLIRTFFGSNAKITGSAGRFRVKTPTGGEVIITPRAIKTVCGGEDVYRAVTLLANARWGYAKVRGSREFMLGAIAHGEANGVNIRGDYSKRGEVFGRWLMFFLISAAGLALGETTDGRTPLIALLVALLTFWAMKRSAKREEQRKAEQMGMHYPRVQGRAGAASTDDLEREGWL